MLAWILFLYFISCCKVCIIHFKNKSGLQDASVPMEQLTTVLQKADLLATTSIKN